MTDQARRGFQLKLWVACKQEQKGYGWMIIMPALHKPYKVLRWNEGPLHINKGNNHLFGFGTILLQCSTCNGYNLNKNPL
jgi:hypothetical protein